MKSALHAFCRSGLNAHGWANAVGVRMHRNGTAAIAIYRGKTPLRQIVGFTLLLGSQNLFATDDLNFEMEEPVDTLVLAAEAPDNGPELLRWMEVRHGERIHGSDVNGSTVMNELRAQFGKQWQTDNYRIDARSDLLLDDAQQEAAIDLRELKLSSTGGSGVSYTVGRQIINWSLPDILSVNDVFPKDYSSYYMGRDAEGEYMKLPSDAVQLNLYGAHGGLDIVYAPHFVPYTIPTGERLSYYSPFTGQVEGEENPMPLDDKTDWFSDDVWYARYTTNVGHTELFAFFHDGYWPTPSGMNAASGKLFYPRLRNWGGAVRGPVLGGLVSVEGSWYDSLEDRDGDDPLIPNSQLRGLLRFDRELAQDLNMTAQYYIEHRLQQSEYESTAGAAAAAEDYELYTLRLNQRLLKQTLTLSFFVFYSPSDDDRHLRYHLYYQPDDHWLYHVGINDFDGDSRATRWAQYHDNSNMFAGVRYYW